MVSSLSNWACRWVTRFGRGRCVETLERWADGCLRRRVPYADVAHTWLSRRAYATFALDARVHGRLRGRRCLAVDALTYAPFSSAVTMNVISCLPMQARLIFSPLRTFICCAFQRCEPRTTPDAYLPQFYSISGVTAPASPLPTLAGIRHHTFRTRATALTLFAGTRDALHCCYRRAAAPRASPSLLTATAACRSHSCADIFCYHADRGRSPRS